MTTPARERERAYFDFMLAERGLPPAVECGRIYGTDASGWPDALLEAVNAYLTPHVARFDRSDDDRPTRELVAMSNEVAAERLMREAASAFEEPR